MLTAGALKILIVGADGLDKLVTVGGQQPYYILECGQQRSRSKPCVGDSCNPTWNTAHKFNLTEEVEVLATIKDEVTKGIIGQGAIDLSRARQYGKDEGAAVLMNLSGTPAGTLRYKLKFQPAPDSVSIPPRASESGSHASYDARSPAGPAVSAEDDPMLAAVTNKVSLAKAAMQQLTAELAELTGADSAEPPSAFEHQQQRLPVYAVSMQERQREAHAGAVQQQRSLRSASMTSSPAAAAVSPNMSPRVLFGGGRAVEQAGGVAGWQAQGSVGPPSAVYVAERPCTEELLATYGARSAAVEQQELSAGLNSTKQLVQQLQEALAAAHAEKVAAEDELSSVKQAMAVMSKQHYLDMKRLRNSASTAAAVAVSPEPSHSIMTMVDSHGSPNQKGLASPQQQQQQQQRQQQLRIEAGDGVQPNSSRRSVDGVEVSSPVPAYKLQIQVHQLERQLAEQTAKIREEVGKREAQVAKLVDLQRQLDAQAEALQQAEVNTRAAEAKAAEQATQAAAARSQLAAALSNNESSSGKESALAAELAAVRSELSEALTEKSELEEALGLMEKNNLAQVAALQAELRQVQEDAAALRQVSSSEEVEYLQAQLRRTLRQVVELQHQVQVLQQNARQAALAADGENDNGAEHAVIKSEHELLMQELVTTKLELAELKEQQLVTQRQLFKAQEILRRDNS